MNMSCGALQFKEAAEAAAVQPKLPDDQQVQHIAHDSQGKTTTANPSPNTATHPSVARLVCHSFTLSTCHLSSCHDQMSCTKCMMLTASSTTHGCLYVCVRSVSTTVGLKRNMQLSGVVTHIEQSTLSHTLLGSIPATYVMKCAKHTLNMSESELQL